MTLRQIIEKYPDWLDHEVVVLTDDGTYDYVDDDCGAGSVYLADEYVGEYHNAPPTGKKLVVFAHN